MGDFLILHSCFARLFRFVFDFSLLKSAYFKSKQHRLFEKRYFCPIKMSEQGRYLAKN